MFKPLILAFSMSLVSLAQAGSAVTYDAWDLAHSATLLDAGSKIQLTAQANEVGSAWAPGTLDLSGLAVGDMLQIAFDFQATAGGDGMGVVLSSGSGTGQFLGLNDLKSGVLAVFNPGKSTGGGASFTMPSELPTALSDFTGTFTSGVIALNTPMHAVFRFAKTSSVWGWASELVVSPLGGAAETRMASAGGSAQPFDDLSKVRFGFLASTGDSAAKFEVFNIASSVPESASSAMVLAGLLVTGAALRRRME